MAGRIKTSSLLIACSLGAVRSVSSAQLWSAAKYPPFRFQRKLVMLSVDTRALGG